MACDGVQLYDIVLNDIIIFSIIDIIYIFTCISKTVSMSIHVNSDKILHLNYFYLYHNKINSSLLPILDVHRFKN